MRDSWSELPLSSVAMRVTAKNKSLIDKVFTVSAEHGLIEQEKFFNKRVASKNLLGYTVVQPGMLVYNKSYSANAAYGVITRNHHDYSGVVSPLYIVFEPKEDKVLGNYLELATNSSIFFGSLQRFIKEGGRAHGGITVSLGDFFECAIPIPSLIEQKRIVDVVSSVDAYIDALQQQAGTARSARNAVLYELLSAGGGDWNETTLGDIAKCAGGTAFPHEFQGGETGTPFVKVSDMNESGNERFLISANNYVSKEAIKSLGARVWPIGTIVFAKVGAALLTEKRRILVQDTIFDNNIMGLVPKASIESHFLYLFMETVKLGNYAQPGAVPSINNSIVSEIAINLPPLVEQWRIAEIVSSMDEMIQSTEQAVIDAKNLRSGLLSELLSGKHEIPASYDSLLGAA
jgi:type I restriction enzyme S subunit